MRSRSSRARRAGAEGGSGSRFVLYVEGPRDRDILRGWARQFPRTVARSVDRSAVILGGRQPSRAVEHFRDLGGAAGGARALCVLDRDHNGESALGLPVEPGLEFFTWPRRHIESYLLVPAAIRRSLRLPRDDDRVDRLFREHVPAADEEGALREFDAKRLLADRGPLARELGRALPSGRIASVMREGEIHRDVLDLFARVQSALRSAEAD